MYPVAIQELPPQRDAEIEAPTSRHFRLVLSLRWPRLGPCGALQGPFEPPMLLVAQLGRCPCSRRSLLCMGHQDHDGRLNHARRPAAASR